MPREIPRIPVTEPTLVIVSRDEEALRGVVESLAPMGESLGMAPDVNGLLSGPEHGVNESR